MLDNCVEEKEILNKGVRTYTKAEKVVEKRCINYSHARQLASHISALQNFSTVSNFTHLPRTQIPQRLQDQAKSELTLT